MWLNIVLWVYGITEDRIVYNNRDLEIRFVLNKFNIVDGGSEFGNNSSVYSGIAKIYRKIGIGL